MRKSLLAAAYVLTLVLGLAPSAAPVVRHAAKVLDTVTVDEAHGSTRYDFRRTEEANEVLNRDARFVHHASAWIALGATMLLLIVIILGKM